MTAPAVWLLVHLECPNYNAIGASLAGTPFVIIGRNSKIGWGVRGSSPPSLPRPSCPGPLLPRLALGIYLAGPNRAQLTEPTAAAPVQVTNTGVDVQDLYTITELSAASYTLDGQPKAFDRRTEVIKVKGEKDVSFDVRETVFGPVITGVLDELSSAVGITKPKTWGPHPVRPPCTAWPRQPRANHARSILMG